MKEIEMWLVRDWDDTLQLIIGVKPVKLQFMWGYPMELISLNLEKKGFPR